MKLNKSQLLGMISEAVKTNGGNKNVQKSVVESVKRKLNEENEDVTIEDRYKEMNFYEKLYTLISKNIKYLNSEYGISPMLKQIFDKIPNKIQDLKYNIGELNQEAFASQDFLSRGGYYGH